MERNQELFEKIELYLSGLLSATEHKDFENALNNNITLKREVELHRFLETEIEDTGSIAFSRKLKGLSLKKKKPFRWKIAASIIILFGTLTIYWFLSGEDKSNLFDKYYSAYPVEDVIRGDEKNKKEKITNAYDKQKFDQIIPELKLLVLKEPENQLLKLYLGNAQLQTGQVKEATLIFKDVGKESSYYEDAQWYLALSYLKLEMIDEAIRILKDVLKTNGRHKKNAQSLLNELKTSGEKLL